MAEEITTPGQIHREHLVTVASNLSQFGEVVTAGDITPVTAQSPVEKSDALASVGAHIIGTEIPHAAADLLEDIKGGNRNERIGKSGSFLSKLIGRVRRKHPNMDAELRTGK